MRYNLGKFRYDKGWVYRMVWIFPIKLHRMSNYLDGIKTVNKLDRLHTKSNELVRSR